MDGFLHAALDNPALGFTHDRQPAVTAGQGSGRIAGKPLTALEFPVLTGIGQQKIETRNQPQAQQQAPQIDCYRHVIQQANG